MINLLNSLNSGFELREEQISEVEVRFIEGTHYEQQREKILEKKSEETLGCEKLSKYC